MAWERQKSNVAGLPKEPSLIMWLIVGVAALVTGVLLFVLHANQMLGEIQKYNLWLVTAGPLFVWFVLICLRGWRYNNVLDKYQFAKCVPKLAYNILDVKRHGQNAQA